jgi:hypothetical protein
MRFIDNKDDSEDRLAPDLVAYFDHVIEIKFAGRTITVESVGGKPRKKMPSGRM